VTSTTHKSLRGPRGGFILAKEEHAKALNSMVFPGIQGGPLMHVIAAKAVAFLEALKPSFKEYQQQVVKNAQAMAQQFIQRGYRVISGRTESHVFLVDLRGQKLTGKEADRLLGEAHITVNKNSIPNDPESPFVTSGIRIGTPAITTRGLKEKDAIEVVNFIADVLDNPGNEEVSLKVKTQVSEMMKKFPVYKR
jgi:glycine hydroxymethyltransferase